MMKQGLLEEVKSLLDNGLNISNQCMQGIGYKEIIDYYNGNCTLEQAVENIKLNTRHYAKRQITFFKRMEGLTLLNPDEVKNLAKFIVGEL